jgi:hypothetical protein
MPSALGELATFARFTGALPLYLARPMRGADATTRLRQSLADRERHFLHMVEHGIFAHASSPYLPLLRAAGVRYPDIVSLVEREGVEGTLGTLYDAGVYVTLDEVKGRRPLVRSGVSVDTTGGAFDNPLSARHYAGMSSGSRGPRTRVNIDVGMLEHEAAYVAQYLDAFDLWQRPYAVYRPVPPVVTGIKWILRLEKLGKRLDRWFSQTEVQWGDGQWKFGLFTTATIAEGRLLGRGFPSPRHVPTNAPEPVARWLAEMTTRGTPAVLDTMVSSAVRVCSWARDNKLDISGTLFRLGGEPLTAAKARLMGDLGCRSLCFYSITEMSFVGAPCGDPQAPDDVHLLTDKVAAIVRPRPAGAGTVDALIYTTLLPSSPKLLLNVESGDFATVTSRTCTCPMGRLGFTQHLHEIRSYEKLTSEGVSFLGTELLRLVEEVLPAAFGGSPLDYQLVEAELQGTTRILIVASPRLGALDERAVIARVLDTLREVPGGRAMTEHWAQGETLMVVRREPLQTASAKVLPLHLQRLTGDVVTMTGGTGTSMAEQADR